MALVAPLLALACTGPSPPSLALRPAHPLTLPATAAALPGARDLPPPVVVPAAVPELPSIAPSAAATGPAPGTLGGPRLGLSADELTQFRLGLAAFEQVHTLGNGLGPQYSAVSCASCHHAPVVGGHAGMERSGQLLRDFTANFVDFWPLEELLDLSALWPEQGDVSWFRSPLPLFGAGLIEAIPDEDLQRVCDRPETPDGVHYRLNTAADNRPGRFGRKGQFSSLRDAVATLLVSQHGITNDVVREKRRRVDRDGVADPEVADELVDVLAAYVRGLAPPAPAGKHPAGKAVFERVGCAACHTPTPHPTVPGAYSDLCIHAMGDPLSDTIRNFSAGVDTWRTPPLWGLRFRKAYLHDQRATSLDAAIRVHGGEAAASRDRYARLPAKDQAALQAFLDTL